MIRRPVIRAKADSESKVYRTITRMSMESSGKPQTISDRPQAAGPSPLAGSPGGGRPRADRHRQASGHIGRQAAQSPLLPGPLRVEQHLRERGAYMGIGTAPAMPLSGVRAT